MRAPSTLSAALLRVNQRPGLKRRLRRALETVPLPRGERPVRPLFGPLRGVTLPLDLSTEDRHLWLNTYEPWVQATLLEHLRPGMVVWDIGAFIGYYVALSARVTQARVLAVEPDADNLRRLRWVVARNRLQRIEIIEEAVAAEVGEAAFDEDGMVGSLRPGGTLRVPVTTLDELSSTYGPPALIVMDIEGGESDAIRGGTEVLTHHRPTLLIELHGVEGGTASRMLQGLGYQLRTQLDETVEAQLSTSHRVHALAVPD